MARRIKNSVVVITGASSGIGRATALRFAKKKARLVLAARREEALEEAAEECRERGGEALAVPTDVTQEEQVQDLARAAASQFGRIDTWFNNAGVMAFGRLEETPSDVFQRILDTNVMGYLHGMKAAMGAFREQGKGVIINNASIVSQAAEPYVSVYTASKAAIRRLSDALRMELYLEGSHRQIHVCTVMPGTIDTPFFQHAANYTGRAPKAMKPIIPPERVAKTVTSLAKKPRREAVVGRAGRGMMIQRLLFPRMYEKSMARMFDRDHLTREPAPPSEGNLFEPMEEYTEPSGGWKKNGLLRKGARVVAAGIALAAVPAVATMVAGSDS